MADNNSEYGDYQGDIKNRQKKRWAKTEDYAKDNYTQDEYNPDMIAMVTPAGHKILLDNKKGTERMVVSHMNGTGFEVLKDGTRINRTIGNEYSYVKGGVNATVQGNADFKYAGHYRQNIDGGSHTETKGNVSNYVGGASAQHTTGNHTQTTSGNYTMSSEKALVMSSQGSGKEQAPVRISLGHDGTVYITGAKNVSVQGAEDVVVKAGSNLALKGANMNFESDGDLNMKAGGKIILGGEEVHLKAPKTYLSTDKAWVPELRGVVKNPGFPQTDGFAVPESASGGDPDIPDHHPQESSGTKGDAPSDTSPM